MDLKWVCDGGCGKTLVEGVDYIAVMEVVETQTSGLPEGQKIRLCQECVQNHLHKVEEAVPPEMDAIEVGTVLEVRYRDGRKREVDISPCILLSCTGTSIMVEYFTGWELDQKGKVAKDKKGYPIPEYTQAAILRADLTRVRTVK